MLIWQTNHWFITGLLVIFTGLVLHQWQVLTQFLTENFCQISPRGHLLLELSDRLSVQYSLSSNVRWHHVINWNRLILVISVRNQSCPHFKPTWYNYFNDSLRKNLNTGLKGHSIKKTIFWTKVTHNNDNTRYYPLYYTGLLSVYIEKWHIYSRQDLLMCQFKDMPAFLSNDIDI